MSGPAMVWHQAAENFDRHWHEIGDRWDAPTTCTDWTVRDLVDHAVTWQGNVATMLGGTVEQGADWPAVKSAMESALADESNLDGVVEGGPFNGMQRHQALGMVIGDLLIHGWDLARSIGADETLPADAVQATLMGLQRLPDTMLRSPGMFGAAQDAPDDADDQTKLLLFTGRQP
jgi:uncharacterized protein (TIGR03086 family)